VQNGQNLNAIECDYKTSCDPDPRSKAHQIVTSDEFFAHHADRYYDIIFIDGLHESMQVMTDIRNSLKFLSDGGTIVMHDCNPVTEEMQRVPRIQNEWTGDTWKAFVSYRCREDLNMFVVDTDYGCGIIRQGESPVMVEAHGDLKYEDLEKYRQIWLNLISTKEFKEWLTLQMSLVS